MPQIEPRGTFEIVVNSLKILSLWHLWQLEAGNRRPPIEMGVAARVMKWSRLFVVVGRPVVTGAPGVAGAGAVPRVALLSPMSSLRMRSPSEALIHLHV